MVGRDPATNSLESCTLDPLSSTPYLSKVWNRDGTDSIRTALIPTAMLADGRNSMTLPDDGSGSSKIKQRESWLNEMFNRVSQLEGK